MCTLCVANGRSEALPIVAGFSCSQAITNSSSNVQASSPTYTNDQIAYQLTNVYWGGSSLSYNVAVGGTISVNITALPSAVQTLARYALELWSDATGLTFSFTSESAQIEFDDSNANGAYASFSYSGSTLISSDVNVGTNWVASYGTSINSYTFQTYIHEIGHALGLGHAGNYNGSATYGRDNHYANDSWQASVMSYFSQSENTSINASYAYAITPQVADIIAIRNLYGTTGTTRTGDTTYGDNADSGDIMQQISSLKSAVSYTIIDDGGTDTLNFSSSGANQTIDLREEAISSVRGYTGNVTISRGSVIENAIGGSGNDVLVGNGANNILTGSSGNDSLDGGAGNDTLIGGQGTDTLSGDTGSDTASYGSATGGVSVDLRYSGRDVGGGQGRDSFVGIENLTGSDFDDRLSGDQYANVLAGGSGNDVLRGQGGSDHLLGDEGNDNLRSGNDGDTLEGGTGNDTLTALGGNDLLYGNAGNDYLYGGAEDDQLFGNRDNDRLRGNSGSDELDGGAGDDDLRGGNGNDIIIGGGGNDFILGDNGSDTITGGAGRDILRGGSGGAVGDSGEDTFVFNRGDESDVIRDYTPGVDNLDLSDFGFTSFSEIAALAEERPSGLKLDFGNGDVLFIDNLVLASFEAGDVIF
ncbi:M10 family metallopeptidase [Roseibium sp. SCP14]|uniref:M10 family metallopeptidase n=1 Tax=Roseibium sp. SCP14 TaxID=3141375 RepID=UPI0033394B57